jgi:hypothetical protein
MVLAGLARKIIQNAMIRDERRGSSRLYFFRKEVTLST